MAGLTKHQRYVIFDGPQQHEGPGTRYFSNDGTSTAYRSKAAQFFTAPDAIDFAKRHNIPIDAFHYIGVEAFTDFEMGR